MKIVSGWSAASVGTASRSSTSGGAHGTVSSSLAWTVWRVWSTSCAHDRSGPSRIERARRSQAAVVHAPVIVTAVYARPEPWARCMK